MARPIWRGAISFGLVNVPVKVVTAVSNKDVRFHQLHGESGTRIQQKRVRADTGKEVSYDEIVKGYEIAPDRHVVIKPEELDQLDPKASRTIEIEDFVDLAEIDPVYYQRAYYLVPDTGAAKPYALLLKAMGEADKVAVARMVMRTKEYLAAIRVQGNVLNLSTMYHADEVVSVDTLDELDAVAEVEVSEREVKMATQLIEALDTEFEPEKYEDTYRKRVLDLIEKKASGEEVVVQPAAEERGEKVVDLMEALQASVKEMSERRKERAGAGR